MYSPYHSASLGMKNEASLGSPVSCGRETPRPAVRRLVVIVLDAERREAYGEVSVATA